ncbi:MAG TPA: type II toxin-antitoxin system RelE/ParE family toxin [Bosea sp. (in: a-proteobacteria)]|jgi:toxin ParE1/3/4|uniref:type II toxin-antitoxin system RelE/ParE family toxin n=1 Tax=Bosea sp. (in: a-proteobacteria) TaxID=1871050 RepID=UPI002DDD0B6D|nr:type II toxin-antitoxin system RelE/ParE family toxin [Bosea sp. (in: a-proteobacteria)]HEV2553214.1 type II toxin-antitoxin system RelE/ParE family toxin [Bosea sp. (in: a-proteobacteria)]
MGAIAWSQQAEEDLQAIWLWIARDSVGAAEAFLDRMIERVSILERFPEAGPSRDEIGEGARALVAERWLVLYRVTADGVQIVRIVDGARDLSKLPPVAD